MTPLDPRQDTHDHWLTFEDCYSWGRAFQQLLPHEKNAERRDLFTLLFFSFFALGLMIKRQRQSIPLKYPFGFLGEQDFERVQHMMRWIRGAGEHDESE